MEEEFDKEKWCMKNIKEKSGMTFEQLKDKYNYHYDRLIELDHVCIFMNEKTNICEFFKNNKDDGVMILLKAIKYIANSIILERAAFSWLATTLWGSWWDTNNYDLSHEIHNLYDLAVSRESKADKLLENINTMCGEACNCYLFTYAKFTNDEMYGSLQKVLNYPKYGFDIPEKPELSRVTYPSKYFSHKEDKK